MKPTKIVVAVTSIVAAAIVACSGAPSDDDVDVTVGEGQVDVTCMKGDFCKPLPKDTAAEPKVLDRGTSSGGSSSGSSGGGITVGGWNFDVPITAQPVGVEDSEPFNCSGPGPTDSEGYPTTYKISCDRETGECACWAVRERDGSIGNGFDLYVRYLCLHPDYPVNRCNHFGRCACYPR